MRPQASRPDEFMRPRILRNDDVPKREFAISRELTHLPRFQTECSFNTCFSEALPELGAPGKSLCLFYVDLDYFKEVNDTFGHLAGDTTLETTAERLSATLPKNSVIGRLAGDEFAIFVDGLSPDENGIVETSELGKIYWPGSPTRSLFKATRFL